MFRNLFLFFHLLVCPLVGSLAQITSSGIPFFHPAEDTFFVPEININVPKSKLLQLRKEQDGSRLKNDVFAIPVEVDISPGLYGVWKEYPEVNKKVWLLSINAEDAVSLNLILSPFRLEPGVKLFLYNKSQSQVLGAITSRNNKESGILPLAQLNSGKIYIELQVPMYLEGFGEFSVSTIGVEPSRGEQLKSITDDRWYNTSQPCHMNVNCIRNTNVRLQKNSVVRIVYRGSQRCTGTLINNLNYDATPYVLTAGHCFTDGYVANTATFYFNYESPDCENMDGPQHTISGSSIVAAGFYGDYYDSLDFTLLKLSEFPPLDYYPFYSGWDATGITPDSTYIIHHPEGDIKKYSADFDVPTIGTASSGGFDKNTHWFIQTYDIGSTEAGSSGAGLISDEDLLIGTLTGGGSPCTDGINDHFQMFSHSYNDFADRDKQLKVWLDPQNIGLLKCKSYDVTGLFKESADYVTNIDTIEILKDSKLNEGWGYLAGHNYQENFMFAEHFTIKGSKYLYGAQILPAKAYTTNYTQFINFIVWEGGSKPVNIVYEKRYLVSEMDAGVTFDVDFDSTLLISNDFYFGFQIAYAGDTVALQTVDADVNQNTSFTWTGGEWKPLQFDGVDHSSHMAIKMLMFDFMPKKGQNPDVSQLGHDISIYPNPSDGSFQVLFKEQPEGSVEFKFYDLSGRFIDKISVIDPSVNYPIKMNMEKGIYIMTINREAKPLSTYKVLIQ